MTGFRPALSLRGAKRRGNPYPKRRNFLSISEKMDCIKGNGLPRQCAHWLAMTAFKETAFEKWKETRLSACAQQTKAVEDAPARRWNIARRIASLLRPVRAVLRKQVCRRIGRLRYLMISRSVGNVFHLCDSAEVM